MLRRFVCAGLRRRQRIKSRNIENIMMTSHIFCHVSSSRRPTITTRIHDVRQRFTKCSSLSSFMSSFKAFAGHTHLVITFWNVKAAAYRHLQKKDQRETKEHKISPALFVVHVNVEYHLPLKDHVNCSVRSSPGT